VGLKQLMAGARRWKLNLLDRNDLMSLSERAAKVTGIPTVEEVEKDAIEKIDEYVKAGCRHFVINFQVSASELKETSKLFAEKVIPHFKHKH
jgi:hypothetical protein